MKKKDKEGGGGGEVSCVRWFCFALFCFVFSFLFICQGLFDLVLFLVWLLYGGLCFGESQFGLGWFGTYCSMNVF